MKNKGEWHLPLPFILGTACLPLPEHVSFLAVRCAFA
jgi:hypothetical protein